MTFKIYKNSPLHYEINDVEHNIAKPDIVFLHGLGADHSQSKQLLSGITGHRVITIDLPGHGKSLIFTNGLFNSIDNKERDAFKVSFSEYAQSVKFIMAELDCSSVVLGGISMGAGIALHLSMINSDLVSGLLIIRPAWVDKPAKPHLNIIADIGCWLEIGGGDYAREQLAKHPLYINVKKNNPLCACSIEAAVSRSQSIEASHVLTDMVEDQPFLEMRNLQQCNIPSLVISNDNDPLHPIYISEEIARELPLSTYYQAPPKYLQPEAHQKIVTGKIQQFLLEIE